MPNWVGDACMATPTLESLRSAFPKSHLVGIMTPVVAELLEATSENNTWFNDVVVFSKRRNKRSPSKGFNVVSRLGIISELRRKKIDIHLLLTNSWWSAAVAHWGRAKTIVGYRRDWRGYYLTDGLPVPKEGSKRKPISAVDYYQAIGEWIGCNTTSKRMRLPLSSEDSAQADELWNQLDFCSSQSTVVINSNAAKDSSRVWPRTHVADLARRLADEGYQVLLHCGPGERIFAETIVREVGNPRVASMGIRDELPISLSRGVLSKASVVVSTDSGARHMAVALDRPVVSLFGSTSPAWTKTYNRPEIELAEKLDCAPCYRRECPLGHHYCMQKLSVDRVLRAVQRLMSDTNTQSGKLASRQEVNQACVV